jgi:hypothetical protein
VNVVLEIGGAGVGAGKVRVEPPGVLEQSVTGREGCDGTRVLRSGGPPLRTASFDGLARAARERDDVLWTDAPGFHPVRIS